MKHYTLKELSHHNFEKQNLVTQTRNGRHYDLYKCKDCGIEGKRHNITNLTFQESVSDKLIKYCTGIKEDFIGKQIKITLCTAKGKQFENLIPDSIHMIVEPPENQKEKNPNRKHSVWVMGIGEPVRLLVDEFQFIG